MNSTLTDLDLLLIGKTGNGKSKTGNTILRRNAFVAKSSSTSVTTAINYEVSEYKKKVIKVVDGPGVGDTRLNNERAVSLVVKAMEDAIRMNTRGYHAFLLVVRFGGRFTQEDVDTVSFLKDIFGNDFVKRFCILVMTCGDSFEYESEETGVTFRQWCQSQTGVFRQLLQECDGRIILFNNVTKVEAEKERQLDELIEMVAGLASQGHRYSDSHFEKANNERQRAIVASQKPIIHEETMQECSLILQAVEKARLYDNPQEQMSRYEELRQRAVVLLKKIQEQDKGTKALHDIEENVQGIVRTVSEAINVHQKVEQERFVLMQQEEEIKFRMEEQIRAQRAMFEEQMESEKRSWDERRKREKKLEKERREREEEARRESREREEKLRKELEEEREKMKEKVNELEKERKAIKEKSNKSWLRKTVDSILDFFGF